MRIKRKMISELNVVPYIDVMLVLLVIFMITTPLLTQGIQVDLPQAKANLLEAEHEQKPIIVSVDNQGNLYLNIASDPELSMTPQELTQVVSNEIALQRAAHHTPQVLVKGDKAIDYGKIVYVMSLLQQAGAEGIGLLTQTPTENQEQRDVAT